jgi:glycosyltransferase involved in cell wall biosynthesis
VKLSIIVPVYNEEKTIAEVINKLRDVKLPVEKEIIIVDDASTDKTLQNIKGKDVKLIKHLKNLGKGAALRTGIKEATGAYIIIQDADLEYDPTEINKVLEPVLKKKVDIVYGSRLNRMPHFTKEERSPRLFFHYLANRVLSFMASVFYKRWITDISTCYKLFPTKVAKELKLERNGFDMDNAELTSKLMRRKLRFMEVPIEFSPREEKEGKKFRTFRDGPVAFITLIKYRFFE